MQADLKNPAVTLVPYNHSQAVLTSHPPEEEMGGAECQWAELAVVYSHLELKVVRAASECARSFRFSTVEHHQRCI